MVSGPDEALTSLRDTIACVPQARKYVAQEGRDFVVDLDLFDRVNHDILMSRIARRMANLLLNDLDQLLDSRGHRFCRYADDCNTARAQSHLRAIVSCGAAGDALTH